MTTYSVHISNEAKEDIRYTRDYIISEQGRDKAEEIVYGLVEQAYSLSEFPYRYQIYEIHDRPGWNLRGFPYRKYLILYSVDGQNKVVNIERIILGKRDIQKLIINKRE